MLFRSHLEVEDYGPDQPQGQLGVAIGDVVIPDVDQFHLSHKVFRTTGSQQIDPVSVTIRRRC